MNKYPMLDKMEQVKAESEICGDFLSWLMENYIVLDNDPTNQHSLVYPTSTYKSIEQILAEYFEIDMKQVEKEKQEVLKEFVGQ